MKPRILLLLALMFWCIEAAAQTTIYWKRDTIYAGPGGGAIATITPPPSDTTVPTTPSGLGTSGVTATSVYLSWTGSSDSGGSGLAGYKIYRQKGSGASLPVGTVNSSTSAFTDQPLEANTSYTWTIVAFDNAQNHSSASGSANTTTSASSGDATAPSAPGNLRGIPTTRYSTHKVRLDWDASTDTGGSGVAGYKVYRNDTLISGSNPVTTLYYEDTTNTANTSFTYKVKAADGVGNLSNYSNAASVTTLRVLNFIDDFWRPNTTGTLSGCGTTTPEYQTTFSCWYSSGGLEVYNFRARVRHDIFGNSIAAWAPSAATTIAQWDFRAQVQILNNPYKVGIQFWDNYPWDSFTLVYYRAYVSGTTIKLTVYVWNGSQYTETDLASASVSAATGTLRLETTMSSREIRVYFNDTLKINYTETDTSRPNRGRVFLAGYVPEEATDDALVDDFIWER